MINELHKAPVLVKEGVNSSEAFSGNDHLFVGLTLVPWGFAQ